MGIYYKYHGARFARVRHERKGARVDLGIEKSDCAGYSREQQLNLSDHVRTGKTSTNVAITFGKETVICFRGILSAAVEEVNLRPANKS